MRTIPIMFIKLCIILVHWKPVKVITLEQWETDDINPMIIISEWSTPERVIWDQTNSVNLII
jgi:hypothetical protein